MGGQEPLTLTLVCASAQLHICVYQYNCACVQHCSVRVLMRQCSCETLLYVCMLLQQHTSLHSCIQTCVP